MLYNLIQTRKIYKKVNRVTLSSFGLRKIDLQVLLSNHIQDLISSSELMTIF